MVIHAECTKPNFLKLSNSLFYIDFILIQILAQSLH